MKSFAMTAALLCLALIGCSQPKPEVAPQKSETTSKKPETLADDSFDKQEMEAAISRARNEVDFFITELSNPTGANHSVKVPIEDAGNVEHFWLTSVSFHNGEFRGTINNEPGIVGNVKLGQPWAVKKTEISDWMFIRGGKIHGNYTMRPLLKTMPEEEAAKFRAMLAD